MSHGKVRSGLIQKLYNRFARVCAPFFSKADSVFTATMFLHRRRDAQERDERYNTCSPCDIQPFLFDVSGKRLTVKLQEQRLEASTANMLLDFLRRKSDADSFNPTTMQKDSFLKFSSLL